MTSYNEMKKQAKALGIPTFGIKKDELEQKLAEATGSVTDEENSLAAPTPKGTKNTTTPEELAHVLNAKIIHIGNGAVTLEKNEVQGCVRYEQPLKDALSALQSVGVY